MSDYWVELALGVYVWLPFVWIFLEEVSNEKRVL